MPTLPRLNAPLRTIAISLLVLTASGIPGSAQELPRTPAGKPDLQGIWMADSRAAYDLEDHAARLDMPAGFSVVKGGSIPYKESALAHKIDNYVNRADADPVGHCFMPGVPRIMYMPFAFQIFQTPEHVALAFEWSLIHRLIYTNGEPPRYEGVESWMGDSRGRWEGDTLVVDVTGQNGETWFDMAGNFHSDAMQVEERYTMTDPDTIQYQATIIDPETFTEPWTITVPLLRQKHMPRLMEYLCQAEVEESTNDFERDPRLWFPELGSEPSPVTATANMPAPNLPPAPELAKNIQRTADGKPDITGYYQANSGGANYGLEQHEREFLTPGTRGVIVDPADGTLPAKDWTRAERVQREEPWRGYDDPTAHCFVAGVPRSHYTPSPYMILQPPGYIVMLFERMAWRIIPLDGTFAERKHIPDAIRLWQGDSLGRWDGDVLTVNTTNLNGRTWLNEVGEVISYAETVEEHFYPVAENQLLYRATVTDPIAYTAPWTIQMQLNRRDDELLEVACLEDNVDLQHLKDVRDEHRRQMSSGK